MKKISLNSVETQDADNGLAIDESLIQNATPSQPFTTPQQKDIIMKKKKSPLVPLILFLAVVAGIGTGYGINKTTASHDAETAEVIKDLNVGSPTGGIQVGEAYGSPEESSFKDSAEGIIQAGGVDGEGSHNLVRPGGKSQTVYLTSSSVDLDKFVGAKVKIWGETFSAQKAGWLMDVGRVKVLELNAELPKE